MAKLEVTRTIEARKLNKRTRQPVAEPPVTIPYGAILTDIVENDGMIAFMSALLGFFSTKRACWEFPFPATFDSRK